MSGKNLLKNEKIADIGDQKDGTMNTVKSLLNSENREQNSGKTEHDWNIPGEQAGRHGKRDKKTAETKYHEKIEKITAYYIADQDFGLLLTNCRKT